MKLIQKEKIQGSGFFNNCIEKNQNKTHFEEGISYYLALIPPSIYAKISIIKNLHYNFPKMRGGQLPFGMFPKNHPYATFLFND